jgi:hypothetical protein
MSEGRVRLSRGIARLPALRLSAKEAGSEGDEAVGMAEHDVEHVGVGIACGDCDLDGRRGLARFPPARS